MEHFEPKKLLLLRILQVLENHSSEQHSLQQKDIISHLYNAYHMECERKTVGRNIMFLEQAGYEICHTKSGVHLASRTFEVG